jgi:hypothetical protein
VDGEGDCGVGRGGREVGNWTKREAWPRGSETRRTEGGGGLEDETRANWSSSEWASAAASRPRARERDPFFPFHRARPTSIAAHQACLNLAPCLFGNVRGRS